MWHFKHVALYQTLEKKKRQTHTHNISLFFNLRCVSRMPTWTGTESRRQTGEQEDDENKRNEMDRQVDGGEVQVAGRWSGDIRRIMRWEQSEIQTERDTIRSAAR